MRPVVYTINGVGTSNVMAPDQYVSPFNVSLGVTVSGVSTYTVQYTFDDVFANAYDPASGNWVDHPSLTAQNATKDSNIAYPVSGIRLTVTAGTGTVRLVITQAGGGGRA